MNWKQHRVVIGSVVLVSLLALTIWVLVRRQSPSEPQDETVADKLPKIDKGYLDELEIRRSPNETVRLVKAGAGWKLKSPVEAEADDNAVKTALDKLAELDVAGVAATKRANHATLKVDAAQGLRVLAKASGKVVLDLTVGDYRGGNTMARLGESEQVLALKGSLKYLFDKGASDWRDKHIVELETASVEGLKIQSEKGTFRFTKSDKGWVQPKGEKPIAEFDAAKVDSLVASLAHLQASGFAEAGANESTAGLSAPRATVTLSYRAKAAPAAPSDAGVEAAKSDAPLQEVVLHLGKAKEASSEHYLVNASGKNDVIYTVSTYLAEKMVAKSEDFKKSKEEPSNAAPPPGGAMPGMPGPGGAPGQGIPPEIMEQLRQQMGAGAGAGP